MSAETVTVLAWKLRRAAEILDRDGDEHGVAADLWSMLADAGCKEGQVQSDRELLEAAAKAAGIAGTVKEHADGSLRVWQHALPKHVDLQQIIYALERQERALQAHADRLCAELDYSAEFPFEDAERMREAVALLRPNVRAERPQTAAPQPE